jgi:hypothetical protein
VSKFCIDDLAKFLTIPKSMEQLSLKDWEELILIFREGKLLASVYHFLIKNNNFESKPDYVKRHLLSAFVHADRQRSQVIYECTVINALLADVNVSPIYLKGANYILRGSRNSLGRIVSDIDLLVPKNELDKVAKVLKNNLWKSEKISDYDAMYYQEWAHEIPPLIHILRDTVLDVHHNLYLPISGRALDISLFEAGAVVVDEQHRVLNSADSVLHSIIHLFMNEDFSHSFRDLFDLTLLIKEYGYQGNGHEEYEKYEEYGNKGHGNKGYRNKESENDEFWNRLSCIASKSGYEKEVYYCLKMYNQLFLLPKPSIYKELEARFKNIYSDFLINSVITRAMTPKHTLMDTFTVRLSRFYVFMRGHCLKMPPHILFLHLAIKSYKGTIEAIMGKHYFDKS